jgi:uncharacterized membrane protein
MMTATSWRKLRGQARKALQVLKEALRPGRSAVLGAATGVFTIFFLMALVPGTAFLRHIGWVPTLVFTVAILLAAVLGALLADLLIRWVNKIRPVLRIALLAGLPVALAFYSVSQPGGLLVYALAVLAAGLAGGALMLLWKYGWGSLIKKDKVLVPVCLVVGVAGIATGAIWMIHPGRMTDAPVNAAMQAELLPPAIAMPDPSGPGTFQVGFLTYGSGSDKLREEYREGVAFATETVDGSRFLTDWSGLRGRMRTRLFGFGPDSLPLNARVWFPLGEGPFPLVLIVHGNHLSLDWSDPGYEYLGTLLAGRGYVFVSVDQNFLNGSHTNLMKGFRDENDARGWLMLKHLEQWKHWMESEEHPLYGKADMDRIALIGHSRGGEAVVHAAFFNGLPYYPDNALEEFDFGFNIVSVAAIAPVDGQYQPGRTRTPLKDINFFVIQGSHDMDMSSYHGLRPYNRLEFSPDFNGFKAGLYVYGANHGQFNTRWGRRDASSPRIHFFNTGQLMEEPDQLQIARVYISAFLDATLKGASGYLPLFMDARTGRDWLPETIYISQFGHSTSQLVCRFGEDLDLSTTTMPGGFIQGQGLAVWREQVVDLAWGTQDTRAVFLGWHRTERDSLAPSWSVSFIPGSLDLHQGSSLIFSLADAGEKAPPPDSEGEEETDDSTDMAVKADGGKLSAGQDTGDGETGDPAPIDFTVELTDAAGHMVRFQISRFSPLQPRLSRQLTKLAFMQNVAESETISQFYHFPLWQLVTENPEFDPEQLARIRLVFDISNEGVVVLNNLGFMDTMIGQ